MQHHVNIARYHETKLSTLTTHRYDFAVERAKVHEEKFNEKGFQKKVKTMETLLSKPDGMVKCTNEGKLIVNYTVLAKYLTYYLKHTIGINTVLT
jgi:hypothetical protein